MHAFDRDTSPGPSSQSTRDIRRPSTPPRSLIDANAALMPLTIGVTSRLPSAMPWAETVPSLMLSWVTPISVAPFFAAAIRAFSAACAALSMLVIPPSVAALPTAELALPADLPFCLSAFTPAGFAPTGAASPAGATGASSPTGAAAAPATGAAASGTAGTACAVSGIAAGPCAALSASLPPPHAPRTIAALTARGRAANSGRLLLLDTGLSSGWGLRYPGRVAWREHAENRTRVPSVAPGGLRT